jgi:hypothetical protein
MISDGGVWRSKHHARLSVTYGTFHYYLDDVRSGRTNLFFNNARYYNIVASEGRTTTMTTNNNDMAKYSFHRFLFAILLRSQVVYLKFQRYTNTRHSFRADDALLEDSVLRVLFRLNFFNVG